MWIMRGVEVFLCSRLAPIWQFFALLRPQRTRSAVEQLNITANVIAPGAVETDINSQFLTRPEIRKGIEEQTALQRLGEVEDK